MNETVTPPKVVAVTGHRPDKLGGWKTPNPLYVHVINELVKAFNVVKPDYLITGMSLGVDQWAAEICINMGIPFVAAIPFENQENKWPPHSKAKYHWILQHAYQRSVICEGGFEGWKMQKRNEWMVNSASEIIAVFNGSPGGTANCVGYALSLGRPIYYCQLPAAGMDLTVKSQIVQQIMSQPAVSVAAPSSENKPATAPTNRLLDI